MPELTQEQWQAIAQEETPTVVDPESQTAYVMVRKEEFEKLRILTETERMQLMAQPAHRPPGKNETIESPGQPGLDQTARAGNEESGH